MSEKNLSVSTLVDLVVQFLKSDQGQVILKQILDDVLEAIKNLFPAVFPKTAVEQRLAATSLIDVLLGLFQSDLGQQILKAIVAAILAALKNVLPA